MGDISHGIPHGTDTAPDYFGLLAGVRTWRVANTMWARMEESLRDRDGAQRRAERERGFWRRLFGS